MSRTSRKKDDEGEIRYFREIDDFFNDKQKRKIPLLFKLLRRTILFLFLFQTVTILIYAIGNSQNFLDENMNLIVKTINITALFLSFFSISGIITAVYLRIKKRTRNASNYIVQIILMTLCLIFAILALLFFSFIDILSAGLL